MHGQSKQHQFGMGTGKSKKFGLLRSLLLSGHSALCAEDKEAQLINMDIVHIAEQRWMRRVNDLRTRTDAVRDGFS